MYLKKRLNPDIEDRLKKAEEEKEADKRKMLYKGYSKTYDFTKYKKNICFW